MRRTKTIGIIVILCVIFLSGCSDKTDYYGGLKKTDFPDLDIVHEYRGHGDNWGAVVFVYKDSSEHLSSRLLLVYNGKEPKPTGEVGIDYEVGKIVGSENAEITEAPEGGIYSFITSKIVPTDDSIIKISVKSKVHSEFIELKTVD